MPALPPSEATKALAHPPDHSDARVMVLRATTGWLDLDVRELWGYRELVYFLAARDISVRYKQTVLGALWALLQPLALMVVFTFLFAVLARIPSGDVPYPLFVYVGLVMWQLFARSLTDASASVVSNERLVSKVYFPRLVIPLAAVVGGVIDFVIALGLMGVLMFIYRAPLSPSVWVLPLFVALSLGSALGVGLWFAALNVAYRDVRHTLPFLMQLWFFATPVGYPLSIVPEPWRQLIVVNPLSAVVEGTRWAVLGSAPPPLSVLASSVVITAGLLISGAYYFRRVERTFADVI